MTDTNSTDLTTGPTMAPPPLDWGRGRYERTADALRPAAQAVVQAADLLTGERVLDLGCGTGNVALLAARAGASVTALDPAPRLLDVTRALADRAGMDVQVVRGEAAALPVPDNSFDAVLSNFAVIFAPDPAAAIAEMARVVTTTGRIVFSAWLPGGAIGQMNATAMKLVREARGAPPPATAFGWHDEGTLQAAFAAHGLSVTLQQHELAFTASSPAAYLAAQRTDHPMAIAGFEVLERLGQADEANTVLLGILEEGNEDPQAFRSTSRYVVVTAKRG